MSEEVRSIDFSMDGFRSNLVEDVEDLRESLVCLFNDIGYIDDEVKDNFNNIACNVNSLLHVSSPSDPNFNEMSDHDEVKLLCDE